MKKLPKPPLPECVDCKHVCKKVIVRYRCRINMVDRREGDTCCWSGKRYPSKFEPKEANL